MNKEVALKFLPIGVIIVVIISFLLLRYSTHHSQPLTISSTEKHKIVVYKDQPVPYYYITTKDPATKGDLWIPIMSAPEDLEKYIDKNVYIEGKFVTDDGYASICRPQYRDECKKPTPFGSLEYHVAKIKIAD